MDFDLEGCSLIRVVTDVFHNMLQSQPGFGGGGEDLIGWQDETIAASISQLEGKGVLNTQVVGPVNAATTGLVDDGADAAHFVLGPMERGQGLDCIPAHRVQLGLVERIFARVAVGIHEQLGVGVNRDKRLEVAVVLDQIHHILHLNLGVGSRAVVGVRAGVGTGTRTSKASIPVSIGVYTNAHGPSVH